MRHELDANLRNWNDRVDVHFASAHYDVEGFLRGRRSFPQVDLDEVGDVRGRSLVHLQCHFGLDTISWARLGARGVGLDFAPRAIARARELARAAGVEARFVEADVHDAVTALGGARFDVYVSLGALCWLPSIRRWAEVVRALLAPGGTLYVRDVHPVLWATESPAPGKLELVGSYFETEAPFVDDEPGTYAGDGALANVTTYEWNHGLGEIVQALLDQGLVLERLLEHRFAPWPVFDWLERGEDGMYRLPAEQRDRLPLSFSLRARAPAA